MVINQSQVTLENFLNFLMWRHLPNHIGGAKELYDWLASDLWMTYDPIRSDFNVTYNPILGDLWENIGIILLTTDPLHDMKVGLCHPVMKQSWGLKGNSMVHLQMPWSGFRLTTQHLLSPYSQLGNKLMKIWDMVANRLEVGLQTCASVLSQSPLLAGTQDSLTQVVGWLQVGWKVSQFSLGSVTSKSWQSHLGWGC